MSDLFKKLAKLREVSERHRKKETFVLSGIKIEIGTNNSEEDAFVQSWAMDATKDRNGFISYYKIATVALSIKALDEVRLDQYAPDQFIETGETNSAGIQVKKERFKLMLEMVRSEHPSLTDWIFTKLVAMSAASGQQITTEISVESELKEAPKPMDQKVSTLKPLQAVEKETEDSNEIMRQLHERRRDIPEKH